MDDAEVASSAIAGWRRDATQMVRDLFRVEPDRWQAQALDAFSDPTDPAKRRIALQACAGPGKTAVLAWMGWNFLLSYSDVGHHPNGAAMSVTGDNLKNNLWKEFAIWHARSELLRNAFVITSERIFARQYPGTWFISARTFPKTANPDEQGRTLSGLHAKYILYLIDESGDIPPAVLRAAEQGLGNCEWGKIAQGGNPTSHQGMLYHAVGEQSHLWHVVRITGDPEDPDRSTRIDLEWARQQIANYGRSNPWVMAYILGQFPPSSINALLGPDDVRQAMARHYPKEEYRYSQKRLGIDIARFGDDATVIFPRQGIAAFRAVEMRNASGIEVAGRVAVAKNRWGSELEMIDDTGGWAGSTIDQCALAGIHLFRVNFSGKAFDPRFFNKRSEMHFLAAEWVKTVGALPNMPEVVREAVAPTYYFEKGQLRVTEKDQIKAILGKSPDYWDAFVTTFALPDMPTTKGEAGLMAQLVEEFAGGGMKSDWDPFSEDR